MMAFFFYDADQQNHTNHGDDAEVSLANEQCQNCSNSRGG